MNIFEFLSSIASLIGLIAAIFALLDQITTQYTKQQVQNWLLSFWVQAEDVSQNLNNDWSNIFITSFDAFFGKEIISWRRVKGAWAISTGSVITLTLLWWVLRPAEFDLLLDKTKHDITGLFTGVLFTAYILNLVPDYFSAIQTRWLMGLMSKTKSLLYRSLILLTDIVLTGAVFYILFVLFLLFFVEISGLSKEIRSIWDVLTYTNPIEAFWFLVDNGPLLTSHSPGNPSIGIFLYSTYFSTLWLLVLFAISLLLMQIRLVLGFNAKFLAYVVESIEKTNRPFSILGLFSAAVASIISIIGWLFF